MEGQPANPDFVFYAPPEVEAGVYANALSTWHTPYDFTIEFAAIERPQPLDEDDPEAGTVTPCRVGVRVKIPATLMFDVIRALNAEMTLYERDFGEIRRPGTEGDE